MEEWIEESFRRFRRELLRFMREVEELVKPFTDVESGEVEPLYEVSDRPDRLVIRVDLPRVRGKEDVEVLRYGDRITIRARMREPLRISDIPFYSGCDIRGYKLEIELPSNADVEGIQATFRAGYLELVIPKRRAFRVRVE
ncbi:MAG: hypothetical protein DRJ96_05935 [Thermoprotei archaeon]|nr:MAG: hypothetical protein DRJ67_02675 [Thermoprotei archaeon]RLE96667.1 MAG: hypothetical protein DRJ96_05935 [Thermoprotei archaeon]